jgi:hypothetical protein
MAARQRRHGGSEARRGAGSDAVEAKEARGNDDAGRAKQFRKNDDPV